MSITGPGPVGLDPKEDGLATRSKKYRSSPCGKGLFFQVKKLLGLGVLPKLERLNQDTAGYITR